MIGKLCVQLKAERDNQAQRGGNEGGNMVREVFSEETMPERGDARRGQGSRSRREQL